MIIVRFYYDTLCAYWHHLYNLKNVKNTRRGVSLLVQLQAQLATLLKVTLPYGCFLRFLYYTNGTKSRKASHIVICLISLQQVFRQAVYLNN